MSFQFVVMFIDSFMDDVTYVRDSNKNEYKVYFLASKGGRCIGLTTSPP